MKVISHPGVAHERTPPVSGGLDWIPDELSEPAPLDITELLARCLGNQEFARRVLTKFSQRFVADLQELNEAWGRERAADVARVAHRLKGTAANASAIGLQRIAARLEEAARLGTTHEIPQQLEELRLEWERFVEFVSGVAPLAPDG